MKRLLGIMLSITLVISLACCGTQDNAVAEKSTGKSTEAATTAPEKTPDKPAEPVTITYMTVEHPSWPVTSDTPVLKKIEETIGVKVEFIAVSEDNNTQKINTVFASGDMPDCMNLPLDTIKQYGSKAFVALDEYIENSMPSIKKLADKDYKMAILNEDGHIYGIPLYGSTRINKGILLRGDLLEKYGLQAPKTLSEFEEVLRVFKKNDPNCIPFATQPTYTDSFLPTIQPSFGLHFDIMTIFGDKMVLNATTEQYKEMLTWVAKLYSEGLFDKEYIVRSLASWEENIGTKAIAGTIAFYIRADMLNDGVLKDSGAYMIGLEPLAGPHGDRGAYSYSKLNPNYNTVITKKCKNVDAAVKYIDFIFSDEGRVLTNWGIEGETYTIKDGKRALIDESLYTDFTKEAKVGIFQQMFPLYHDAEFLAAAFGPQRKLAAEYLKDLYVDPLPNLGYTPEVLQEKSEIWATLKTHINEYTHNVITGKDSISNWDKFQDGIKKYKGDRYMELTNEAYSRYYEKYNLIK